MSATDDTPPRGGLARSLDDLFERTLEADEAGGDAPEASEASKPSEGAEESDVSEVSEKSEKSEMSRASAGSDPDDSEAEGRPDPERGAAPDVGAGLLPEDPGGAGDPGLDSGERTVRRPPRPRDVERADPFMDVELLPDRDDTDIAEGPEPPDGEAAPEGADGGAELAGSTGDGEDRRDEQGDHRVQAQPATPSDSARLLAEAVREYREADRSARDVLARRIRALAGELRDAGEYEPIVDAVESLAEAGDEAPDGEGEAPFALAQLLTGPRVASRLCTRLGGLREEVAREIHARRAARLGPEMAEAVGEALAETEDRGARRLYMDVLLAMGEQGMRVVARMVEDSRWFVVRNAVLILGESGGEDSVQHLTTSLAHDDPRVRKEALLALAKIGGEDAEMLVYNKLDDAEPSVREAAARAVGVLAIERAVKPMIERLEEESDEDVQVALLRALGQVGDPGAVPTIEKKAVGSFFSRPSTPVRVAAYRALAAIGTPHARQLVEDALEDRDAAVQSAARSALQAE